MGKRELLIISAFVAAGIVVYWSSGLPARPNAPALSWRTIVDAVRPGGSGPRGAASTTVRGTLDLTGAITEARVSGISRLVVRGSDRDDIAYELTVNAMAADDAAATAVAARTALGQDQVGSVMALRLEQPRGGRVTASLTLDLPARLAFRTDGGPGMGRFEARHLASVRLESVVGDVLVEHIAGPVTGSHRNGHLTIRQAGTVQMTFVSSQATLEAIPGSVAVSARNGQLQIGGSGGAIELDATNQQVRIDQPRGEVHVLGTGGALHLTNPSRTVTIDVRRMAVNLSLTSAVPVAVLTADALLSVALLGPPDIVLDASATDGGRVRIGAMPGVSRPAPDDTRLVHTFGRGGAIVALRNQRADIVIEEMK